MDVIYNNKKPYFLRFPKVIAINELINNVSQRQRHKTKAFYASHAQQQISFPPCSESNFSHLLLYLSLHNNK